MKLCLRIALLVACLVGWTVTQDLGGFDLADAFDDDAKPTVKPPPEKPKVNVDAGGGAGGELDLSDAFGPEEPEPEKPKKPAAGDNDNNLGGFDLADALGPDPNPKPDPPAVVPPKNGGGGGGSFDDSDLMGVGDGDYKPDGGRSGGRGAVDPGDTPADQPQDLYLLWGRVLTMLNANMPDEVHIWIANVKEVMKPLLARAMELLETIQ